LFAPFRTLCSVSVEGRFTVLAVQQANLALIEHSVDAEVNPPGDELRAHLHRQAQSQPEQGLCRPSRWHPRGRRPDLAGQLPRL
jgi:hypothetical protein